MFLHNLKYELKSSIRAKDLIFWLMIFPVVLGTFFKIAFDGIYEKTTKFNTIPVAVVEVQKNPVFNSVAETLEEGDTPFLKAEYTDRKKALELLENEKVEGIIYLDEKLSLSVAEEGIEETMLKAFVEEYTAEEKIITDAVKNDPMKAQAVIDAFSQEVDVCKEIPLTQGNPDNLIQYFYNLIAMVGIYGTITGLHITINKQANLSALGARNNCSPTPKSVGLCASLIGSFMVQAVCMIICVTYLAFVLRIDFGDRLPPVYLAAIIGGMMGVSLGFMVGSIGRMSVDAKVGISMAVSMTLCFLSGLMVGDMKAVVASKIPWFNNINPVAVMSDSFYCLNIYSDYRRFLTKIATLLIMTAVFSVLGFIFSRRKKYASL